MVGGAEYIIPNARQANSISTPILGEFLARQSTIHRGIIDIVFSFFLHVHTYAQHHVITSALATITRL
jgi:hypothetical protein